MLHQARMRLVHHVSVIPVRAVNLRIANRLQPQVIQVTLNKAESSTRAVICFHQPPVYNPIQMLLYYRSLSCQDWPNIFPSLAFSEIIVLEKLMVSRRCFQSIANRLVKLQALVCSALICNLETLKIQNFVFFYWLGRFCIILLTNTCNYLEITLLIAPKNLSFDCSMMAKCLPDVWPWVARFRLFRFFFQVLSRIFLLWWKLAVTWFLCLAKIGGVCVCENPLSCLLLPVCSRNIMWGDWLRMTLWMHCPCFGLGSRCSTLLSLSKSFISSSNMIMKCLLYCLTTSILLFLFPLLPWNCQTLL